MFTLKDIFINDPKEMTFHYDMNFKNDREEDMIVIARVHMNLDSRSKHWSFYLEEDNYLELIEYILKDTKNN